MALDPSLQNAFRDFEQVRFRAVVRDVLARLTRTSADLLSFAQVAEQLQLSERTERGLQTIPVAAIVGSVGRAADYTRDFLPRRNQDQQRWANVRNAFLNPENKSLPPIQVYQVGQVYFVLDGNHRVSVARAENVTYIEANVIEIRSPVELTPDIRPEDLICKAELAEFLVESGLAGPVSQGLEFSVNQCGQYPKLRQHITAHQLLLKHNEGRELTYQQAAADWLANVYAPLVRAIRERGMLEWFPDYTETDLYLWVLEHQQQLRDELGWDVPTEAAATDLAVRSNRRARRDETATGSWRALRLTDRYLAHAFQDILVAVSDSPASWHALEQAILIARHENARVHGLHVSRAKTLERGRADAADLQARFLEQLAAAGIAGDFAVETGAITPKITERALLNDLVVLHLSHPPAGVLSSLTSGWRAILRNAARPVLAVPQEISHMRRVVLLFDNSPRAREALFIAAYLGETWHTHITVLTLNGGADATESTAYARAYLELHELDAAYLHVEPAPPAILDVLSNSETDLLLLGSDATSPLEQLRNRALTPPLLREARIPLLIAH